MSCRSFYSAYINLYSFFSCYRKLKFQHCIKNNAIEKLRRCWYYSFTKDVFIHIFPHAFYYFSLFLSLCRNIQQNNQINKTSYHNDALTTTESQIINAIWMLAASILIRVLFGISIRRKCAIIYVYIYICKHAGLLACWLAGARAYATHCSYSALLDSNVLNFTIHYSMSWFLNALCVFVCIFATCELRSALSERLCHTRSICSTVCSTYIRTYYTLYLCVPLFTVYPKCTQMMW